MKIAALLPMKGHSERVPGKNFKMLGHKPLFRWMLDTLSRSERIEQIIINTDAASELTEVGLMPGDGDDAKVLLRNRRPELVGDMISMNLVIADDIENIEADLYLMTHVTNPFISLKTVESAIQSFEKTPSADSLFAVNKFQTRFYRENGDPINHDPDNLIRTQDLEPWYEENSCLYLFTRSSFAATQARIGKAPILFETPRLESVDIDEPEDWSLAEALSITMFAHV